MTTILKNNIEKYKHYFDNEWFIFGPSPRILWKYILKIKSNKIKVWVWILKFVQRTYCWFLTKKWYFYYSSLLSYDMPYDKQFITEQVNELLRSTIFTKKFWYRPHFIFFFSLKIRISTQKDVKIPKKCFCKTKESLGPKP